MTCNFFALIVINLQGRLGAFMSFANEDQQNFIGKLEKAQEVFREIKEKAKRRLVIQHKNRDAF